MSLEWLQEQLALVLADPEPSLALERLKAGADPQRLVWLERIQPQGLQLAATLVLKLRFDRVMRGDPALAAEYDSDPDAFTREFLDYCRDNPPRAYFPAEEAAQFHTARRRSSSSAS